MTAFTRESHATLELKPQADRDAWHSVKLRLGDRDPVTGAAQ
jgi:hypothetical protein